MRKARSIEGINGKGELVMIDGKRCASLCVLETDQEYLLIRRGKEKNSLEDCVNQYIPIGGKLEPLETPEEAVIREVQEETGILISCPKLMGIVTETSPLPKYNWVLYIFVEKIKHQMPKECNEGDFVWVKKESIPTLPTPEIDQKIYEYIQKNQKFIIHTTYDHELILQSAYEYLEGIKLK